MGISTYPNRSRSVTARRLAALALLGLSATLLGWSLWPIPVSTAVIELPPLPGETGTAAWRITLVWPRYVRLDETVELRLEAAAAGAPPDALAARLELPGLAYAPQGESSQAVPSAGRPAVFRWSLRAETGGEFDGTAWLHRLENGAGLSGRQVLSAQRFHVRTGSLLGLGAVWAQALGLAGIVIGAIFSLDGVLIWFWRRFIIQ